MRTGDFNSALTSKVLNEQMYKTFGVRVNFEKYDRAQLENYRNVLRTNIHQMENTSGFNELLANESYQKNKHLLELLNTRIKEMLGEAAKKKMVNEKAKSKKQQQAAGIALAAKRAGKKPKGKGAAAKMAKMSTKELEKFAGTKHKGLPVKKKKKKTKVSENIGVDPAAQKIFDIIKGTPNLIKNGNPTTILDTHIKKYLRTVGKGESDMPMLKAEIMDLLQNSGLDETRDDEPTSSVSGVTQPSFQDELRKRLRSDPGQKELSAYFKKQKTVGVPDEPKNPNNVTEAKKKPISKKPAKKATRDWDGDGEIESPKDEVWGSRANAAAKAGKPFGKKASAAKKKSKTNEAQLRNNFKIILEGIRYYIAEDEEGKAMDITAGADMVKDFTSWMQRLGQYQTKSTIELADSIRSNFGPQEAEQFKTTVTPAIQSSLEALTASREIITKAVSVLAGEEQPDEMMGQPGGEDEEMPSFEPEGDSMNVPPEEGEEEGGEDQYVASDAASAGREEREVSESRRQRQLRKLHEANSIMRRLAG